MGSCSSRDLGGAVPNASDSAGNQDAVVLAKSGTSVMPTTRPTREVVKHLKETAPPDPDVKSPEHSLEVSVPGHEMT